MLKYDNEPHRWKHPKEWADKMVPLGTIGTKHDGIADLYALPSAEKVSFGARFSDEPGDYESGTAYYQENGDWSLHLGEYTAHAAARFFAHFDGLASRYRPSD